VNICFALRLGSEHTIGTSFALKADSHNLDGTEAFSFDQAFDVGSPQLFPSFCF
jgi:hypothetical protein